MTEWPPIGKKKLLTRLVLCFLMLRLHWTTFSLRPYHVLKIQERGEDGVKMKQFRISKFPLRPYYVPATFLLRPHHVLHVSTTSSIRVHQVHPVSTTSLLRPHKDQAVHTTRKLRFQYVLTKYINQSCIKSRISCETA